MCEILCNEGWSLIRQTTCSLGRIEVGVCVKCGPGEDYNSSLHECQPCPLDTYKVEEGAGPCLSCPSGSTRESGPADSHKHCICNSSLFRDETVDPEPFICKACPDNAVIPKRQGEGRRFEDCKCEDPYSVREVNETTKQLESCRLPRPCNLTEWLQQDVKRREDVGTEEHQLRLGTCETTYKMVLGSGMVCQFECRDGTAPQVGGDLFMAISRDVACEDGIVESAPPVGTWCSEGAWRVPPLLFLGAVTISAVFAMCDVERRQRTFERQVGNSELSRINKKYN